jgi:hypothetical protein
MSTTVLHAPRHSAAGRAGAGFWQRLWQALETSGQRRAATELRRAAWRFQTSDPAIARQLLDAAEYAERA